MKILGIALIILGVVMCVFTSVNFTTEKKVVDLGPLQINKKENKTVGWPLYAGIAVGIGGIVCLVVDKKSN